MMTASNSATDKPYSLLAPSRAIIGAASALQWAAPAVLRSLLYLWSEGIRRFPHLKHWLYTAVSRTAGYWHPVNATLSNGMPVVVPWNNPTGRAIYDHGCAEAETVDVFNLLLRRGHIVFDVGSQIGQYTLLSSSIVGTNGQVHAFDPDARSYKWLRRNLELNSVSNVVTNPIALADTSESRLLHLAPLVHSGATSLVKRKATTAGTLTVECDTVDGYVQRNGIQRIDLIKMDVEGAEIEVLMGAQQTLTGTRPPVLVIEFNEKAQRDAGRTRDALPELLNKMGFSLYRIREGLVDPYLVQDMERRSFNVVALREDIHIAEKTRLFQRPANFRSSDPVTVS